MGRQGSQDRDLVDPRGTSPAPTCTGRIDPRDATCIVPTGSPRTEPSTSATTCTPILSSTSRNTSRLGFSPTPERDLAAGERGCTE